MTNLNHQEIMRLEGLVKAYEKKLRLYEEFLVPDELNTAGRLGEVNEEIEYYKDHKNF